MNKNFFGYLFIVTFVFFGCGKESEEISEEKVIAWGINSFGQLDVPTDLNDVKMVVAGNSYSLALKNNGLVVGWGKNDLGQIDIPANLNDVDSIVSGGDYSLALKKDGTIVAWGKNDEGQTNVPENLKDVAKVFCNDSYTIVILKDGTLAGWGSNQYEQLNFPANLNNVVKILPLTKWVVALKSDGLIEVWGKELPYTAPFFSFADLKDIVFCNEYTCLVGLKNDGTIIEENFNYPNSKSLPINLDSVEAISADFGYMAILLSGGHLISMGAFGATSEQIETISNVKKIFSGVGGIVILKTDGTLAMRGGIFFETKIPNGLIDVTSASVVESHMLVIGKIKK